MIPQLSRRQALARAALAATGAVAAGLLAACGGTASTTATAATASTSAAPVTSSSASSAVTSVASSSAATATATSTAATTAVATTAPATSVATSTATTVATVAPATSAVSKAAVTLRFLASAPDVKAKAFQQIIAEFQQATPGVAVSFEPIAGSYIYDKIAAELAAGTAWDVIENHYGKIDEYAFNKALLDLSSYYAQDKQLLDDVFPAAVSAAQLYGKTWAATYVVQPQGIYVNLTLFKARALPAPTRDWTIDQYTSTVGQVNDPSKQHWGTGIGSADWWFWWTYVWNLFIVDPTYKKVTIASPEMLRMWEWYFGTLARSSPTAAEEKQLGSTDPYTLFGQGHLATLQIGSWVFGDLQKTIKDQFEWTVQEVPTSGDGQKHVAMSARALCSPHFTKYPAEVWQFMRYFAFNPNAAKQIVTTGDVPVVKSVATSDTYIQPQVMGGAKGAFAHGVDYAISSSIRQYPPGIDNAAFQKPYQDAQKAILAGTEGIDDGARTSQDQMQRLADAFWAKAGQ